MTKKIWIPVLASGCMLFSTAAVRGDDIDVFVGGANSTTDKPNILIIIDNSSNWTASLATDPPGGPAANKQSKFYHERKALGKILDYMAVCQKEPNGSCKASGAKIGDGVRMGLMMFTETGTNGAYVRYALRDMNQLNRNAFKCMLTGEGIAADGIACDPAKSPGLVEQGANSDSSGSNQPYAKVMFEAFKYFGGYTKPAYAYQDQEGTPKDSQHFGPIAYAGWSADSGSDKGAIRRDYAGNSTARSAYTGFDGIGAVASYASGANSNYPNGAFVSGSPAKNKNVYKSPVTSGCAKNFVIFISNGNPGTGGDSGNPTSTVLLSNVGGTTTQIKDLTNTTIHASDADEFARFLHQTDVSELGGQQNVTTFSVAVYDPADAGQTSTQSMIKLMSSMGTVGGGGYYEATDGEKLVDALLTILNQILARDSTFVTASLPVNANAQGEFENQVYIGMFRPDGNGNPRWWGNLKQYRLACMKGATEDTSCSPGSMVRLVDSSNPPQVIYTGGTSFIGSEIVSYWTTSSSFWASDPRGTSTTWPLTSDKADGEVVEKGGVAERLRTIYATSQSTRNVLTCTSSGTVATGITSSCPAGSVFPEFKIGGALTAADENKFYTITTPIAPDINMGSKTKYGDLTPANKPAEFSNLIDWLRGKDNVNPSDERGPGGTTTVRPSIHGDVVHSRPVAIDFGSPTGVILFYGSNDGFLRAVKGTTDVSAGGGSELWSFIAPEFFPKLARLRSNTPVLLTPATPGGIDPAPTRKDYFWDGTITAYQSSTQSILFVTARRGGRFIYAIDVTTPATPKFLWKIDPSVTGFGKLGQTWSAPVVAMVKGRTDPVLIFGGGYPGDYKDGTTAICEDAEGASRDHTDSTNGCDRGYGIYVVDAFTGSLIKHIEGQGRSSSDGVTEVSVSMNYAIPADVYPMDSDYDGNVDRLYVGDLGGRLWRIELSEADENKWKPYLLGDFGSSKKFFYRPSAVQQQGYTAVMVGSGDREKPLDTASSDGFYMVKDTATGLLKDPASGPPALIVTRVPDDLCLQSCSGGTCSCSTSTVIHGWRYAFQAGEKVVNSPRVAFSVLNFATNVPQANTVNQCLNTGEARSYQVDFLTGKNILTTGNLYTTMGVGGLAPTTFVGVVNINGNKMPVVIGGGVGDNGDCVGPTCASAKTITVPSVRKPRYWYKRTQ